MKLHIRKRLVFVIPVMIGFSSIFAQTVPENNIQGIVLSNMELSVKPNEDFYKFVNGGWLKNTEIPADKTRWGTYDELRQKTDIDALNILKEAATNPKYKSNTDQGKAVNLYKSILDTVGRNKKGLSPLKPYLAKINAVKNVKDLQALLIEMDPIGGIGFMSVGIDGDAKNSNRNVIYVSPGSLGLPDRDYYVSDDKDSKEKRDKYVLHVARMLQFLGEKPKKAKSEADKILALETTMSQPRFDRVERRDRRKSYNLMTVSDLQKLTPSIDWNTYLTNIGLKNADSLIVSQPKYMVALEAIFKENKVEDWKAYMRWTLLNRSTSKLSTIVETANWEFYGKTLTGAIKQRPRDESALQVINGTIGEALGKLYVEKKFPPEAKAKAEKMIKNIFLAFENRINNLTWMSAETKIKAIEKLHKIKAKIGYPDKWKDYSTLTLKSPEEGGSYFENMKNISLWSFKEDLDKLKKPVDKTEWAVAPQIVNAFYNPSFNEITFPAGVLQPPFYNYQADEAINYGSIGCTIGHEVSHAFDDSGSRYDSDGNLNNWWTAEDLKQFTVLTGALADQYSAIEPLPGIHVDGKFTLGENIGDLGGVNVSFDGLQLFLKDNGRPELINGYNPEQRFYISWTTKWRSQIRDEALKNQLKTDPHSPGMYRAYVPLQNVDAFYKAFNIKPGDGMYVAPEKRVKIW
ncbi:M13 family metallopeptidase [Flavobacterium soyangense]|uniref:M13 family metallopeptidase n=1 Tax=Flavobacterium soyangense TaxID=2023265 RepID=A0A930XUS9_9FLAO|nr:M13 family metallopeptidase [Flavobacterium soyangense]MBF2707342.1 M13 family metallopeptidase [Flavobacterium soyangense]